MCSANVNSTWSKYTHVQNFTRTVVFLTFNTWILDGRTFTSTAIIYLATITALLPMGGKNLCVSVPGTHGQLARSCSVFRISTVKGRKQKPKFRISTAAVKGRKTQLYLESLRGEMAQTKPKFRISTAVAKGRKNYVF